MTFELRETKKLELSTDIIGLFNDVGTNLVTLAIGFIYILLRQSGVEWS